MIGKNTFLYINFSKETILIFGVIWEPKGWIKQLELIGEYLRHRRREMREIGIERLYSHNHFSASCKHLNSWEIDTVVTKLLKLLYREVEKHKKEEKKHE